MLDDAAFCLIFLTRCRIQPVLEFELDFLVIPCHENGPEDIGSLLGLCIQHFPEFALGDHDNLLKLASVNVQEIPDRLFHRFESLYGRLIFFIKGCIFLLQGRPLSPVLFSLICRRPAHMIGFSLVGKIEIYIAFGLRICIFTPEVFGIPVAAAGLSV